MLADAGQVLVLGDRRHREDSEWTGALCLFGNPGLCSAMQARSFAISSKSLCLRLRTLAGGSRVSTRNGCWELIELGCR